MDTSPDAPGDGVSPQIIRVTGDDIVLNREKNIVFRVGQFPEILRYAGEDVVFTDGTTLLGADDKAGIAAIMTMAARLCANPGIAHAAISIAFTPDEEIGRGTEHFDIGRFGAAYAYTFDGGEIGELEFENFNAACATLTVTGVGVHPARPRTRWRTPPASPRILRRVCRLRRLPKPPKGAKAFCIRTRFRAPSPKPASSFSSAITTRPCSKQRRRF